MKFVVVRKNRNMPNYVSSKESTVLFPVRAIKISELKMMDFDRRCSFVTIKVLRKNRNMPNCIR